MKIAVIGYSGAGKSTLATKLGRKYDAEVLHLDRVHWLPGWQERDTAEKEAILSDFLNSHDNWVIDGNYTKLSYPRRMAEADEIIFMNFNRVTCFARSVRRYRTYKGKSREPMTEGCPEKIDREFALWLLWQGRTKKRREKFYNILRQYPDKVTVLRNQRQLDRFEKERKL